LTGFFSRRKIMGSVSVIITTNKDTTQYTKSGQEKSVLRRVANLLRGLDAGKMIGNVKLTASSYSATAATGTITLVSAVATNAVTFAGVTFTFTSTPTLETDVEVDGASDTADAAALAAAFNAHATIKNIVYATSALGVVTLTCRLPGVIGNYLALSKSGAPITVSGAYLTGGAGGSSAANAPLTVGK
jgi:phage tail sheath gpL-like